MTTAVGFREIRGRFFAAIASAVGLDPSIFDRPGTTVVSTDDRTGSRAAVIHGVGAHSLVWCDPFVADRVEDLADDSVSFPVDEVAAWASDHGEIFVGGARSLLADSTMLIDASPPAGSEVARLRSDDPGDRVLIARMLAATDPDDADAAEVDVDELDPHLIGLVDEEASLAALATERPWEYDDGFANIGVLVVPDRRRGGWGRAAVSVLATEVFEEGRFPLYRCNWDREPSHRLALSVGFEQITSLAAIRFTDAR